MTEYDMGIRNATVWTEQGFLEKTSVFVSGERIAAVLPEGRSGVSCARDIDGTGLHVLPGLIDTHSHHRDPGFTHKEDIASATSAAALGGVTVSVGMPNVDPPTNSVELYRTLVANQSERAVVDFNHNPAPTRLDEIEGLAAAGCLGFKVYMVTDTKRDYPHMPGLGVHDSGMLLKIFRAIAETGRPVLVHPNDQSILEVFEEEAFEAGDLGYRAYAPNEAKADGLAWNAAVALLTEVQRATGVRLHVLHMMNPGMIRLVRAAKDSGAPVTSEVNPFALFLSDLEKVDRLGPLGLGRCVPQEWVVALWGAIGDGTIDVLGTDHAPHTRAEKEIGWENMWKAPSGTPQLQDYLSKLLDASHRGLITLDLVARITSHNPARIFGLYPRKGTIREGADADLVIVDLGARRTFSHDHARSKAGYSPYDGEEAIGAPVITVLRGRVIAEAGEVVAPPGYGRLATPVS